MCLAKACPRHRPNCKATSIFNQLMGGVRPLCFYFVSVTVAMVIDMDRNIFGAVSTLEVHQRERTLKRPGHVTAPRYVLSY